MQVSTTMFPPGSLVELFPEGVRPTGPGGDASLTVPDSGLAVFQLQGRPTGGQAWVGGMVDGEWRAVQVNARDGEAVHPADRLALTRPAEAQGNITIGARGTRMATKKQAEEQVEGMAPAEHVERPVPPEEVAIAAQNAGGLDPQLRTDAPVADKREVVAAAEAMDEADDDPTEDDKAKDAEPSSSESDEPEEPVAPKPAARRRAPAKKG